MWNYEIVLLGGKSTWAIWATWAPPEANRDPPNANRAIIVVCKWPTHVFRRIHKQKDVSLLVHLWFIMVHYGSLYGSLLFSSIFFGPLGLINHKSVRQGWPPAGCGSLWFIMVHFMVHFCFRPFCSFCVALAIFWFSVHDMVWFT